MAGIVFYSMLQNLNKGIIKKKAFGQIIFLGVYSCVLMNRLILDEFHNQLLEEYYVTMSVILLGFLLSMLLPFNVPEILYMLPLSIKERKSYLKWSLVYKMFMPLAVFLIIEIPLTIIGRISLLDTVVFTVIILAGSVSLAFSDSEGLGAYDTFSKIIYLALTIVYITIIRGRFDGDSAFYIYIIMSVIAIVSYIFIYRVSIKIYKDKMKEIELYEYAK